MRGLQRTYITVEDDWDASNDGGGDVNVSVTGQVIEVQASEEEAMRGFRVVKGDCRDIICDQPLLYYVGQAVSTRPLEHAASR